MITNYILNQNNLLTNFNYKNNNYINNKNKEKIIDNFINNLNINIIKAIKARSNNFNLIIKNALFSLWNSGWLLGSKDAESETNIIFLSSEKNNIEFSEKNKEKRLNKKEENRIKTETKKQEYLLNNKTKRYSKLREDAIKSIETKRQTETRRGLDYGIPLLEQTEFGKTYVDKRINVLSNNLNDSYRKLLGYKKDDNYGGIIPDYLKSNKVNKDSQLVYELNSVLRKTNKVGVYEKKLSTINNILDRAKENKETDKARLIAEEIADKQRQLKNRNIKPSYRVLLENRIKSDEKRYNDELKNSTNNIEIRDKEKEILDDLNNKSNYSIKELRNYKAKINEQIKNINNNTNKIKRLGITELGYAYNLGRLEWFANNGVKYVKWNNSEENINKTAPNNYQKIYKSRYNKMSPREQATKSFQMMGIVCPVCQERASRNNGYGKGVYKLTDVINNPQLQIALHPHCLCYLESVNIKDDEDKDNNKNEDNKLFDNDVAKWALGGGISILGSALMYELFKRSLKTQLRDVRKIVDNGALNNINKIKNNNNLNKNIKTKLINTVINNNTEEVINTVVNNDINNNLFNEHKDEIISAVNNASNLVLPLVPLDIPTKVKIDDSNKELISNTLNKEQSSYSDNSLNKTIDNNITETNKIIKIFNSADPNSSPTLKDRVDEINTRLSNYFSYSKNDISKEENKLIINQFKSDIKLVQQTINNIDNIGANLYAQYISLFKVREDAINKLLNALPDNIINKEQIINTDNTINNLNNSIINIEDKLRRNNLLTGGDNSYRNQLKYLENSLLTNNELKKEYLNSTKGQLTKSINNIPNEGISNLTNELNKLDKIITEDNITDIKYRQLMIDLEVINYQLDKQIKLINNNLINIDLDFIISNSKESKVVGDAEFLMDYRLGVKKLQTKLFILTNMLINKKPV